MTMCRKTIRAHWHYQQKAPACCCCCSFSRVRTAEEHIDEDVTTETGRSIPASPLLQQEVISRQRNRDCGLSATSEQRAERRAWEFVEARLSSRSIKHFAFIFHSHLLKLISFLDRTFFVPPFHTFPKLCPRLYKYSGSLLRILWAQKKNIGKKLMSVYFLFLYLLFLFSFFSIILFIF